MRATTIILRTTDIDASTGFWADKVGLDVTQRFPGFTFLDAGSLTIILSAIDELERDESLTEVAFDSDDVRAEYAALEARGVEFDGPLSPPIMSQGGRDLIAAFFRDPDGHYGRLSGWEDSA